MIVSNEPLIHDFERGERKEDRIIAYDFSAAQNFSSSTCPPRNIYHIRRVLAMVAELLVTAALRKVW